MTPALRGAGCKELTRPHEGPAQPNQGDDRCYRGWEAEGGRWSVCEGRQKPKSGCPVCQGVVNVFCTEPGGKFVGFAGHMVSVATAVLLHDSGPAAGDNPSMMVPVKLY